MWTVFGQLKSFRTFFFNPPTHLNPFGERIVKTVQIFGQSLIEPPLPPARLNPGKSRRIVIDT